MKLAYLTILIPTFAWATVKPQTPEVETPPAATSESKSSSLSNAASSSASTSNSYSNSASSSNSNSGGNSLTVNESNPRQVGAVAQGSIIPPGCGAGGNAGGAGPNGTGFLGFSFVTPECHGWTYVATLAALGMHRDACEAAKRQNTSRRAKRRGAPEVDCSTLPNAPVPPQSASTAPPVSVPRETQCASKEYVGLVADRVAKACASK